MSATRRFLVFHTAFIGDLVLTLPVMQSLRASYPDAWIGITAIPAAAALLQGHPAVDEVIVYDKRGVDAGLRGFLRLIRRLRATGADCAIVPHRSLRSALAVRMAGIPRRIGFTTSAGSVLFTDRVAYDPTRHEVDRDLALLAVPGLHVVPERRPILPRSPSDADEALRTLHALGVNLSQKISVALAPGSVWFTKRWPARHFTTLAQALAGHGYQVVLVGGADDRTLCEGIAAAPADGPRIVSLAGRLSLRASAEVLRLCGLVITNDSAPLHLAGAVGTTTFALFGATVPAFGFGPLGPADRVFGVEGLTCRPCAIHGGRTCPIGTFDCMERLDPEEVLKAAVDVLQHRKEER